MKIKKYCLNLNEIHLILKEKFQKILTEKKLCSEIFRNQPYRSFDVHYVSAKKISLKI